MTTPQTTRPEMVLAHVGWVRSLALHIAGHGVASEDVAQETWLRVLRNPPPDGVALRDWIAGTARKVAVELSRQSRRRREREMIVAAERSRAETRRQVEIERDVVERVLELDEPYRRTVLSRYFEQRSAQEIADAEGISPSTVNTRLSKAYAELRRRLAARPDSAAGAFFGFAAAKAIPLREEATAKGAVAKGVSNAAWIPATLGVVLLGAVGIGAWFLRGESHATLARAEDDPVLVAPPEVEPSVSRLEPATGPVAERSSAPEPEPQSQQGDAAGEHDSDTTHAPSAVRAQSTLSPRVVDDRGTPLPGAMIVVRRHGASPYSRDNISAQTGPRGEAVTLDCARFQQRAADPGEAIEAYVRTADVEFEPRRFSLESLPAETVDLVLAGAFGALRFECVDDRGLALDTSVEVRVIGEDLSSLIDQLSAVVPAGGAGLLSPVPLNAELRVLASPAMCWSPTGPVVRGPSARGEVATRRIEFLQPRHTASFRVAPECAVPSGSRAKLQATFTPTGGEPIVERRSWTENGTDFVATFRLPTMSATTGTLEIQRIPESSRLARAGDGITEALTAKFEVTFPGVRDRLELGLVDLAPLNGGVRGRVLDAEGRPAANALVRLLEWTTKSGVEGWYVVTSPMVTSDRDGTFPPPATRGAGPFSLMATRRTDEASRPVAYDQNDAAIELQLGPAATLQGRVVVPEGADPTGLSVRLADSSAEPHARAAALVREDGTFVLRSVTADTVTLEVGARRMPSVIARLDDVRVGRDDPRIAPWDLRDHMRVVHVRIEDEHGNAPDVAIVCTRRNREYTDTGAATLLVPDGPAAISIAAVGHRTFHGTLDELPSVVRLRRGYEVELEIHAGPETAATRETLVALLFPTGTLSQAELAQLDDDEWPREASRPFLSSRPQGHVGGVTTVLCAAPGEYFIRFRERAGESGDRQIDPETLPPSLRDVRVVVEDTESVQRFRIDFP